MALGKAKRIPFLEDAAAANFAHLIRRQGSDSGIKLEKPCTFPHQIGWNNAVSIDDGDNVVVGWGAARYRPETIGKSIALSCSCNPYDHEINVACIAA